MSSSKQFIPVYQLDDIDHESSKGFTQDETNIFLVKKDGIVYAYKNQCPHLGIPLEMQEHAFLDMDNAFIQCSTHGALFNVEDGLCIAGPCQGESLQMLEVEIVDSQISVDISTLENE